MVLAAKTGRFRMEGREKAAEEEEAWGWRYFKWASDTNAMWAFAFGVGDVTTIRALADGLRRVLVVDVP